MPPVSFNVRRINNIYDNTVTLLARITAARAGYLDNLNNAQLLNIPNLSTLTAARILKLDNLNATVSSRAAAATALDSSDISDLDAAVSSRAAAATALTNATWTNARALIQDGLKMYRPSTSTLITSNAEVQGGTSDNYVRVKEISMLAGAYTIEFEAKTTGGAGYYVRIKIYVDNVEVYAESKVSAGTYVSFSTDVSGFKRGSSMRIDITANGAYDAYIRNLSVKGTLVSDFYDIS